LLIGSREPHLFILFNRTWLNLRNIITGHPAKKLDTCQMGPFEVLQGIPHDTEIPSTYCLRLPLGWKVHLVHVSLLRPATINMGLHTLIDDSNLKPPPDVVDEVEEYKVKRILQQATLKIFG
jgi:hypothetical protein